MDNELSETLVPVSARHRTVVHQSSQTEATFVPSCIDLKYTYEPKASEQFQDLTQLRSIIQLTMHDLGSCIYDVFSFKDILFRLEEELPSTLPVNDLLMMSSKLYRKSSELCRLMSCFFSVVFGDEHADEHFHFTEIRILQRELLDVKQKLKESEEEKAMLQKMLANVGQVALDHGKAVELLENHNQALQLQTNALEDQMALLFHQLNEDLETNCREAYDKVTLEMEVQERMNPTRTTFRQTMDSLSQQIRSSRTLISEVREALMSCNQGGRTGEAYLAIEPSIRFKLKMLDSDFQQLVGRFNSVKDTVVETAHELMNALHERKKILYLSYQHIRLYDLQNSKVRHGKAILTELRNYTTDLLRKMQSTFPSGAITSVDRIGRITTQRWHGGYTLAALRKNKAGVTAPALSEAEIMAAESELAAFSGGNAFSALSNGIPKSLLPDPTLGPTAPSTEMISESNITVGTIQGSKTTGHPMTEGGGGGATTASRAPSATSKRYTQSEGGVAVPETVLKDAGGGNAEPFENVHVLLDLIRYIDADITKLNDSLTLEDEMSAFLKTLTLSVASTARTDTSEQAMHFGGHSIEKYESSFEAALLPTGGQTSYKQRNPIDSFLEKEMAKERETAASGGGSASRSRGGSASSQNGAGAAAASGVSKAEQAQADALLARQAQLVQRLQEQNARIADDFASKLGFVRQVYEARISDLEMKEANARQNLSGNGRVPSPGKKRKGDQKDFALVRDINVTRGEDEELLKLRTRSDRESILAERTEWQKAKPALKTGKKLREATMTEIDKIEQRIEERKEKKRAKSKSAANNPASPK